MPIYNYVCSSCSIIFEELVSIDYYKEPQEHDECGTLCNRTAEGQEIVAHGIGLTEGRGDGDKAKIDHRWMEEEIGNTKTAIKGESGVSPYTNYKIDNDVAVEKGLAKKVSPKKSKERQDIKSQRMKTVAKGLSETDKKRSEGGHNVKDN
jgi:putative FmdB family regulatory protein